MYCTVLSIHFKMSDPNSLQQNKYTQSISKTQFDIVAQILLLKVKKMLFYMRHIFRFSFFFLVKVSSPALIQFKELNSLVRCRESNKCSVKFRKDCLDLINDSSRSLL